MGNGNLFIYSSVEGEIGTTEDELKLHRNTALSDDAVSRARRRYYCRLNFGQMIGPYYWVFFAIHLSSSFLPHRIAATYGTSQNKLCPTLNNCERIIHIFYSTHLNRSYNAVSKELYTAPSCDSYRKYRARISLHLLFIRSFCKRIFSTPYLQLIIHGKVNGCKFSH